MTDDFNRVKSVQLTDRPVSSCLPGPITIDHGLAPAGRVE